MRKKSPLIYVPFGLVAVSGVADVVTSLIGWSRGFAESFVTGGTFLWIIYWLVLFFVVYRFAPFSLKTKVCFLTVCGVLLFYVPIHNVLVMT